NLGFIMFEPDATLAELEENYTFLEGLGLLVEHELTANLLYHNQIVLHGSAAWERFERQGRLLVDARLPFEARYRFRDDRVGLVCSAMGCLSSAYFRGIDALRLTAGNCCNGEDVNALLKEAFLAFCSAAKSPPRERMAALEEGYLHQLRKVLAPSR
ncbi:MAG TPA: hypothetical protein VIU40_01310, partial [Geobacteraceae bacterium]